MTDWWAESPTTTLHYGCGSLCTGILEAVFPRSGADARPEDSEELQTL